MSSRINILIPDGDSTWALSVIQCLSPIEAYNIFVLSNKKRTATKFSKHTFYYKFYERGDDNHWLSVINTEIETQNIEVILPIAEVEIGFFIKHKVHISKSARLMPLPRLEDFQVAIDKRRLSDFSKLHAVPHPKSFYITSEKELQNLFAEVPFPYLIKPLNLKGGDGIERIDDRSKLNKYIKSKGLPFFVQEYIEGYDIDCSVLCFEGEVLTYTIQKGNLKGHNIYAPQLGFDFLKNEHVLNVARLAMKKLNWSGVAHLDMRYDKNIQDYKLIEINARFWGSIEASKKAGINFPHLTAQLSLGNMSPNLDYKTISYMRLKGVFKTIKRHPSFLFKNHYLMNNTEVKSFLKDPFPTLYKFREWLGRRF